MHRINVNTGKTQSPARTMEDSAYNRVLGPRTRVAPNARLVWGVVAVACAATLGVARFLEPDARGFGTHQQLAMYPCSFVVMSGLPCPTCGMTTSFSLLMHGRPWSAFMAQPAGAVLCAATACLLFFSIYVAATGWTVHINWDRVGSVRLMLGIGLLILGGWGFKIAHGLITGVLPAG